jgi:hypothetical protein
VRNPFLQTLNQIDCRQEIYTVAEFFPSTSVEVTSNPGVNLFQIWPNVILMSGRSQHERDGSCRHRRADELRSTKLKSDVPLRVERLCSWLHKRDLFSCSMLYTLSPNALVDIPFVFLLDLHHSLPNSLLLVLSHGTHQNAQSIPQPGRTAKPPRRLEKVDS